MRLIVSGGCVERFAVVRQELPVVACTRHKNVGNAAVEGTLSAQFGIDVNQNTVGGLSLVGSGWSWHSHDRDADFYAQ